MTRITDLASEYGVDKEFILGIFREMGFEVRTILSPIGDEAAKELRRRLGTPPGHRSTSSSIHSAATDSTDVGGPDCEASKPLSESRVDSGKNDSLEDFPALATPVAKVPESVREWLRKLKRDADDHLENSDYNFREAVRDLERKGIAFTLLEVSCEEGPRRYFISNSQTSWQVPKSESAKETILAGFNSAPGALSVRVRNHFFTSGKLPRETVLGSRRRVRVQPLAHYGLEFGDWSLLEVLETRNGERVLPLDGSSGDVRSIKSERELEVSTSSEFERDIAPAEVETSPDSFEQEPSPEPTSVHARSAGLIGIHRSISNLQDEVLRASARGVLVLTGIPGSGKTSVGLMRIAWLLDPQREENEVDADWNPIDPKSEQPWKVNASKVVIVSRAEHLKNYIETGWNREYNYGSISVEAIEHLLPSLLKNWLEWHPQDQVNPPRQVNGSEPQKVRRGPLKFRPPSKGAEVGYPKLGEVLTPHRVDAFLASTLATCSSDWQARQDQTRDELDTAHRLAIGIASLPAVRTWLREGAFDASVKSWIESAIGIHTGRNGSIEWLDLDRLEPIPDWLESSSELGLSERIRRHFALSGRQADLENPVSRALELRQHIQAWVQQNLVVSNSIRLDDIEAVRTRTKRLAEQLRERWPELRDAIRKVRDLWKKPESPEIEMDDQVEEEIEAPQTDERVPDPSSILAKYRSYWRRWAYNNLHPRAILAAFRESVLGDSDARKRLGVDAKPASTEDVFILLWLLARLKGTRSQSLMTLPSPWDHIMIDEAQLFPAFQINALLQFTSGPLFSATVCGDPHQRTFKDQVQWSPDDLVPQGKAPLRRFDLQAGYRWGTELLPFFKDLSRVLGLPYADAIRRPDNLFLARGERPRIQVLADNEYEPLAGRLRQIFDMKRREACVGLILPGGFQWTDNCELHWALSDANIPFQHAASGREISLDPNTVLVASCDDMIGLELDHVAILHPEEILTRPDLSEDDSSRHFWTVATRARLSLDLFVTEMFLDSYGDFARAWVVGGA